MTYLLCRNRVANYRTWYRIFSSHKDAHQEAGLILEQLWREADNPENVFYLFRVDDLRKATAFISTPDAKDAARESGVVDGEYHFVEASALY